MPPASPTFGRSTAPLAAPASEAPSSLYRILGFLIVAVIPALSWTAFIALASVAIGIHLNAASLAAIATGFGALLAIVYACLCIGRS